MFVVVNVVVYSPVSSQVVHIPTCNRRLVVFGYKLVAARQSVLLSGHSHLFQAVAL